MKTARLFTCLMAIMLVFAAWTPSTAYAAPAGIGAASPSQSTGSGTAKMVKLTIGNRTGGPLFVTLVGPQTYSFYVPDKGKDVFLILSGTYQYTVTGCGGSSISKTRSFKGGGNLGPYVCRKK